MCISYEYVILLSLSADSSIPAFSTTMYRLLLELISPSCHSYSSALVLQLEFTFIWESLWDVEQTASKSKYIPTISVFYFHRCQV